MRSFVAAFLVLPQALYMMALHPAVEARVVAEVLAALGPDGQPNYDDISNKLPYCTAVIQEVRDPLHFMLALSALRSALGMRDVHVGIFYSVCMLAPAGVAIVSASPSHHEDHPVSAYAPAGPG
jgi:hypothetical protein